jgi:hypothetical protein
MSKKFKAVIDDSGLGVHWTVWNVLKATGSLEYVYAEFHGKHCGQYARDHAKRLNALSEKEKP